MNETASDINKYIHETKVDIDKVQTEIELADDQLTKKYLGTWDDITLLFLAYKLGRIAGHNLTILEYRLKKSNLDPNSETYENISGTIFCFSERLNELKKKIEQVVLKLPPN